MWNSRVTLTVVLSLVGLGVLCSLLGAAYMPFYSDRRDARLTQVAAIRLSETVVATRALAATQLAQLSTQTAIAGATQTEAAQPTTTATATATPTTTPTPTATLPAAIVECPATVAGAERLLFPVPGGGRVRDALLLPRAIPVTIVGRLEDQGWLQVRTGEDAVGWMHSDVLTPNSPNCQANVYDLSYLLGMAGGREVVADDTFINNENGWTNSAGEPLSPVLSADGDAQLILSTNNVDVLRPSNPRLQDLPTFELVTSFSRVNFFSDSYIGVRFRANNLTSYEVRVLRNCQIGVYATNGLVFTRPVDPGENTCVDDLEDWLMVSFTPDYRLTVQLNDADPFEVRLEDPSGLYTGTGLEFVVGRARATFSYIVVTAPR
ncbi:MAG: hypothetical protein ACRDH2_09785 [Anaerolineales bacterium]